MLGAAKVARNFGSAVNSITFHGAGTKASGSVTGFTMNYPAGTAANDIAVLFESGRRSGSGTVNPPAEYFNPGWTKILSSTYQIADYAGRAQISYKVLTSFDDLTSISGMPVGNNMILLVFRPDATIAGASAKGISFETTTGNPSQKTIAMAGEDGPVIGFGWYDSQFVIDPRTSSITMSEVADNTNNWQYAKYKIYNKSDSPESINIDMDDESTTPDHGNTLAAFYLKVI